MVKLNHVKLTPVFRPKRFTTFVALLIIGAGLVSSLFAAYTNYSNKGQYLVGRAQTIADSVSAADIKGLTGSDDDLTTLAYARTQQQLQQVRDNNPDISYIRTFKLKDGKATVSVDAQPISSSYYGNPGLEITNASNQLRSALLEGNTAFDPVHNEYRERWTVGYAPVRDANGSVVAAVGVFTGANTYYLELALYALVPLLLAAIPFAGIMRDIKIQSKEHEIMHLKNQFISIASHELRSPLSGMLWGITALESQGKKLSCQQKEILHNMFQSTEASLATVNEILDSSIFERGQAKQLQKEQIDMRAIFSQITATLQLSAKEKNIKILYRNWDSAQLVQGDVESLKRAVMNIVANAIKYSPEGSTITIGYRFDDKNEHVFSIQDEGIGIPHDEQEKVLDGYYRASNVTSLHATGTGLGLWTSKLTIEQHGGRLWINSLAGKGTTIYIALAASPANEAATGESAEAAPQDQSSSRNSS